MRRLIPLLTGLALIGALGCGEERTVSDGDIVQALNLERDDDSPVYAIDGDEFCQVEQELLNDSTEVEEAKTGKALVLSDPEESVGIQVVPPFDPACEQDAQRALKRLGEAD